MFMKTRYSDIQQVVILGLYTLGMCLLITPICTCIEAMYGRGAATGLLIVVVLPMTSFMAWRTIR